jgi:hypothetical protein
MEWKLVSKRSVTARLGGKQVNVPLFPCYAPTNDTDEEIESALYKQLQ